MESTFQFLLEVQDEVKQDAELYCAHLLHQEPDVFWLSEDPAWLIRQNALFAPPGPRAAEETFVAVDEEGTNRLVNAFFMASVEAFDNYSLLHALEEADALRNDPLFALLSNEPDDDEEDDGYDDFDEDDEYWDDDFDDEEDDDFEEEDYDFDDDDENYDWDEDDDEDWDDDDWDDDEEDED